MNDWAIFRGDQTTASRADRSEVWFTSHGLARRQQPTPPSPHLAVSVNCVKKTLLMCQNLRGNLLS